MTTLEYPTPAKRPTLSVLPLKNNLTLLSTHHPYWRESLREMKELRSSL
ncbi:MAG: hypothetical protein RBJ76_05305 [Stenomitos frigidus ULC029]